MYRGYYDLRLNPFKIEPDPEFLWLGEKHLEGLATLQYGILENKGFLLLTGDVGTGKTVLIHQLRKNLPGHVNVAVIQDPGITVHDLYRILSAEFQIGDRFAGKADFLIRFKRFVIDAYASQRQVLIIIDEAHRLGCELLDEIRMLANIDYENRKLINIFFVGQNEFNRTLLDPRNEAVRQRITVSYHLCSLDDLETPAYIRHRLKVAGSEKELFTLEAFSEIHRLSGGTPRLINLICDRALMTGYVKDLKEIGLETIRECATELDVSLGIAATASRSDFKTSDQDREHTGSKLEAQRSEEKTPSAQLSALSITKPVESGGPGKPLKRNYPWLLAALAGTLGILLYFSLSTRPSSNIRQNNPAAAVSESTGGRHPATIKSPAAGEASARSEGLTAMKTKTPSGPKDPVQAAPGAAPTALPRKEKIDPPAVVTTKRDPWEKMPVAVSVLKSADENSTTAGVQSADRNTASEIVSAPQSAAPLVQRYYVLFKPGSADLENRSFDVLKQVAQILSAHPNSRITLALFFDPTAKSGYTSKLLALRANCVKSYLTSRGVEASLTVVGRSAESLTEIQRPPGDGGMESWAEIRIETG